MARRFPFAALSACAILTIAGLSACGGSSSTPSAGDLLRQTFAGGHDVHSGRVQATFSFDGKGIKSLTGPVSVGLTGPFQSSGKGQVPKLDLSLAIQSSGVGSATVGIVSTGDKGYLRLQNQTFVLDDPTFQKLKASYEQNASKSSGGGPSLKSLGIKPLDWLTNPRVAQGTESVGGADTYHVTAGVDVARFATDLTTLLDKASALSSTTNLPTTLTPQQRQDIVSSVKSATFEVWTGKDDKTLRRVRLDVGIDVPPAVRSRAGGLTTGTLRLDLTLSGLNQSQEIKAPAHAQPLGNLQSLLGAAAAGSGGSGSAGTGGTGTGSSSSSSSSKYLDCLAKAKNDVAKTQQCAALIGQ